MRTAGVSKYGISRTFRVILDLIAVCFSCVSAPAPVTFFGGIGLALTGLAGVT